MKVKLIVIGLTILGSVAVGFVLFMAWLSLGGCPPSYWVTVYNVDETTNKRTPVNFQYYGQCREPEK